MGEMRKIAYTVLLVLIVFAVYSRFVPVELPRMAVLAVSQIYVQPKGYEDPSTHEWKGSFWVVLATTSTRDDHLFYKFDKAETEKYFADNTVDSETVYPKATITVSVKALDPYWQVNVAQKAYTVFPKTYGMGMNRLLHQPYKTSDYVDPLYASVWEPYGAWEHHAPFEIVVEKSGDYSWKSDPIVVDLVGYDATVPRTITSSQGESVIVTLHGLLETGYGQPTWSDLIMFDENNVFVSSEVRDLIRYDQYGTSDYAYSNYWFGGGDHYQSNGGVYTLSPDTVRKWSDDGSPAHYIVDFMGNNYPVGDAEFPGSYRADTLTDYVVKPIRPKDVYTDVETATPYGKSLIKYLTEIMDKPVVNLNLWNSGYTLDTSSKKLKINQPKSSASWLFTLQLSTELADTYVYQPIVGQGKIVECRWAATGKIGDKDMAIVKVKQLSSEESRLGVVPSIPSGLPVKITPSSDAAIIAPNDVHTFNFEVKNLGTAKEQTSTITFKVKNDLGTVTDTASLTFTLLPTGVGETILTIYTMDAETPDLKISGISVTISWDTSSKSQVTSGGYTTFSLGTYQGGVSIATLETTDYQSASKSVSVTTGQNSVFLYIQKRGTTTPWWKENIGVIIFFIIVAAVIGVSIYAVRRYRKRR